ncbi:Dihydroorotase [Achromobacter piechaudii]|uniref:Dihydroorotase n=3 Tax=Alcaligenaceae TaxID=506 RepID=A0A6S7E5Q2_9BURK|nr:dihydroorotase, homodimeric type [Achromobacter piechaudii ATCC 43553]CAB3706763.1 Dihydroorotase [Achromobacter piechaudii]CAB3871954.1 Dihydroorotase [Achromobacter piechaudii]CAB3897147.1 Dihydroorotase [Achromobacter piechaudii]CAB3954043.1 Dihydroorotase [Achromobacter piechaudii]
MSTQSTTQLTITRPDDWHLHLRDGAALEAVVADTARQFARAIIMPNLKPPVTTTEQALAYRDRILQALRKAGGNPDAFTPLMTLYLTDNTSAEEIRNAHASGQVYAVKLYPAGATTNSDAGVTDLLGKCTKALEALEKCGMPLLVHGEVTDPAIDVFDREAIFVERVMKPLRRAFPALKVVFEHITTKEGAEYVRDAEGPTAATITPQHMLYNRNAIFQGGVRPHWYCLPILKRETHRLALVEAATSGSPRFFLGTDSAPHARGLKEHACGCAGCYTALHAMELYATAFDAVGKLDKLEGFASFHGPDFYGLPRNTGTLTLVRETYQVPAELAFGNTTLVPLAAGEALAWRAHA